MMKDKILLLVAMTQLVLCVHEREIILNEDYLTGGTCTLSCGNLPTPFHGKPHLTKAPYHCDTVKNCRLSTTGWNRDFVRCDYCKCICVTENPPKDVLVENVDKSFKEPDLYGTCTRTCVKSGLVRTDFEGCQEVRDCVKTKSGWTRGFVRCDYCQCKCINRRNPQKYTLKNIKYTLDTSMIKHNRPKSVAKSVIKNCSPIDQKSTRNIQYEDRRIVSVQTAKDLRQGLKLTVEASASIGKEGVAAFGVKTSLENSIEKGFTVTHGSTNWTTITDSQQAETTVPGRKMQTISIIGRNMEIDIPYSADLVTTYTDGVTRTRKTEGIFLGVETNQFEVNYSDFEDATRDC